MKNTSHNMKSSILIKYIFLFAVFILTSRTTAQANEHVNTDSLIQYLTNAGIKTFTWNIDQSNSWEDLKNSLPKLKIAGISINVSLLPPSKTPPINPVGTYSEPFKLDFIKWAKEIANLSLRYSNIKEYIIEDTQENLALSYFRQIYIDSVEVEIKSINPKLKFNTSTSPPLIYYISNKGNDSYSGLSPDSAWKTISKIK